MVRIDTLSGDFKIYQPNEDGQRYSTDDMLTAWMALICSENTVPERFLDLGSGLCSVPMIVLWKFKQITGVGIELRESRYALGLKSLALNEIDNRFRFINGDLRTLKLDEKFNLITSTPPYYANSEGPLSPYSDKAAARFELNGSIDDYFFTAAKHLSENGQFITVYPFQYIDRVYGSAGKYEMFVNKRIDMIPRAGKNPLVSLFSSGYEKKNEEISEITVRDENGLFTSEYNDARVICGFKPKK